MNLHDKIKRLGEIISELAEFYGELTEELPNLRVVVDNTRAYSDVKKTVTRLFSFRELMRRKSATKLLCKNRQYD